MNSSISQAFQSAAAQKRSAFIPYITAGFPDLQTCESILRALDANGSDIIEVGIPFSDPLADGPTIQASGKQALDNGVTPPDVLEMISRIGPDLKAPLVLMTYVNPVLAIGYRGFADRARDAGVSGVIIPDLPLEEAQDWLTAARDADLDTILMVGPTTPKERMKLVAAESTGFLYYVSMTGVTGSALHVSDEMSDRIREARDLLDVPVAVGFGVSTPDQARSLGRLADGVIVGSALIRTIQAESSPEAQIDAAARLTSSLSRAMGAS